MTLKEIETRASTFFEFPTENKDHVTTISTILFAHECCNHGKQTLCNICKKADMSCPVYPMETRRCVEFSGRDSREAFEHWFSDHGANLRAVERSGDNYRLMQAQQCWDAWQIAWKLAESV